MQSETPELAASSPAPLASTGGKGSRSWLKRLRWLVELLVFLLLALAIQWWQSRSLIAVGEPVPDLTLTTLAGAHISLYSEGVPTILYIFSPWCSICRFSTPTLVDLRTSVPERELRIIAIGLSWQNRSELQEYSKQHAINFPLVAGDNRLAELFHISSFPTFYIIDGEGRIASRTVGYTSEFGLRLRAL